LPISLKEILLLLWILGAFGMTARFAKGLHGLRSLRKNAAPIDKTLDARIYSGKGVKMNLDVLLDEIPLFFHPLFIFATKQLQNQQEHICDDWVIQFSRNRKVYAQCLLRQAEAANVSVHNFLGEICYGTIDGCEGRV